MSTSSIGNISHLIFTGLLSKLPFLSARHQRPANSRRVTTGHRRSSSFLKNEGLMFLALIAFSWLFPPGKSETVVNRLSVFRLDPWSADRLEKRMLLCHVHGLAVLIVQPEAVGEPPALR